MVEIPKIVKKWFEEYVPDRLANSHCDERTDVPPQDDVEK